MTTPWTSALELLGSAGQGQRVHCSLLLWSRQWCRSGAFSNEGAENLDDGRVVSGGVHGNAFEGIDAAQTHVEFVVAELLDGLSVAVGE